MLLRKYPGSAVHVSGHTDAIGKETDNEVLGQSRAYSVKVALIAMGVSADAIQTESKGETQLLIQTQKAEPKNRRTEVRFEPSTVLSDLDPGGKSIRPRAVRQARRAE